MEDFEDGTSVLRTCDRELVGWISEFTGPLNDLIVVKRRPWSTVLKARTASDDVYFKVCNPASEFEPDLISRYAALAPRLIARNRERTWILLADAGRCVREISSPRAEEVLAQAVADYAHLQVNSTSELPQLRALGLPDRSPSLVPELLMTQAEAWRTAGALTKERHDALLGRWPVLQSLCDELAAFPSALDHGDFHSGNIVADDTGHSIIDWGDACLAHPFCSLTALHLECKLSDELLHAYLRAWSHVTNAANLARQFDYALRIGLLLRAVDMAHMLGDLTAEDARPWTPFIDKMVGEWLASIADE